MDAEARPRPTGRRCSMCGSKRAHIEWDARTRMWFCALNAEPAPRASVRRVPPAPAEPAEPRLPALRCDRCGEVLLGGAADGVQAYCARCRRWVVQAARSVP